MNLPNKRFFFLIIAILVLTASIFLFVNSVKQMTTSLLTPRTAASSSIHNIPFITEKPIVVLSGRKVCSTLGQNQIDVGIYGEDGGHSAYRNGMNYFAYGDVIGPGQEIPPRIPFLPNSVSYTTDTDASACMELTSKSLAGQAVALQDNLPALNEVTNWHLTWVDGVFEPGYIHFYYVSWRLEDGELFRQGVGMSKMNTLDLSTERLGGCTSTATCFLWNENSFPPGTPELLGVDAYTHGDYVYLFREINEGGRQTGIGLSRVHVNNLLNYDVNDYEYWDGGAFIPDASQIIPLWGDAGIIWYDPEGNPIYGTFHGIDVTYNDFLDKFVVTYNTGMLSIVESRTADNLTGPWSEPVTLVNCPDWVDDTNGFFCYGGAQHPQFFKNNGQIMYQTYSNGDLYQAFMHEIVLGTPIYQWENTNGNTAYKQEGISAPAGFTKKGIAFYASSYPYPEESFTTIYEWYNPTFSQYQYSPTSPGLDFISQGVAFYTPIIPVSGLAPIHHWVQPNTSIPVYSTLDLSQALGYTDEGISFYAKITDYRLAGPTQIFPTASDNWYEVRLIKDGDFIPATLTAASFSGLTALEEYNIIICNIFGVGCEALDSLNPTIAADESGEINGTGYYEGVSKILVTQFPLIPQPSLITGLEIEGLTSNTTYDLWVCAPDCSEDVDPIIYEVASNVDGNLSWGILANQPPILKILDPDVNDDGSVDLFTDIMAVANAFGSTCDSPNWNPAYDLDGDCSITLFGDIFPASFAFGLKCWPITEPGTESCQPGDPLNIDEGQLLNFYVKGTDPDGDPLTYSIDGLPDNACFNGINSDGTPGVCLAREFEWTPSADQSGSYSITFTVDDGTDTDSETLSITVLDNL